MAHDVATLVEGSPFAMPALSLVVFIGAICPVPGLFTSGVIAAGFTLGFWRGLLAVHPAAVLGACTAFAAGRALGERGRAYIPSKVVALCDAIGDGGFSTLLLLRLTPLVVCYSAAFLGLAPGIRARDHAVASAAGFLRLAIHVYIGTTLRHVAADGTATTERWVSLGGALLMALSVGNVARLMLQRSRKKAP